jgi:hypothetical protein
MDARTSRQGLLAVVAVALLALAGALVTQSSKGKVVGPHDTATITGAQRAAGPRFAATVAPGDRAWIEAAMRAARPEAQPLIALVDGLVEFRTVAGAPQGLVLPDAVPLGLTRMRRVGGDAAFTIDLNTEMLDGLRVQDRDVVVLHELGHVIDLAAVPIALGDRLEAAIPPAGACPQGPVDLAGSCTDPAERFADTFAKWALRGRVSAAGAGYGVPSPPSLEDWGAPLPALAR